MTFQVDSPAFAGTFWHRGSPFEWLAQNNHYRIPSNQSSGKMVFQLGVKPAWFGKYCLVTAGLRDHLGPLERLHLRVEG